jgi:hypothetical protein
MIVQTAWRKSSYSSNQANCVEIAFTGWRKSSRSNSQANCVEIAVAPLAIGVRDTKDRTGGTLAFPTSAWHAFLTTQR